jgi:hypothetical protein
MKQSPRPVISISYEMPIILLKAKKQQLILPFMCGDDVNMDGIDPSI